MDDVDENAPFLPMHVDYLTQVHRVDGTLYRLYLLCERKGNVALRVTSASPLKLEVVPENERAADLGFIRFIRKGDLGEAWEIDSIQKNENRLDNGEVRDLFHSCWTAATASPDYRKADWNALRQVLADLGYDL
jgi:hypothetical protein